ncbi:LUD domain-containing protein [Mycobacterium sp. NAZ190054]|uniref:LutC/YkgG family protein n=1 Tax=Mycobacterium sp. NAZ190054 TaxID=1747766 RepID=UPI000792DC37|nr:LUD domain-containing protein [Mycobacterium sp. NAZ190054]KWX67459.1 lactate utilization protein C [Mycobacterium sp. NAZ190054]
MSDAKTEVLGRIRRALESAPPKTVVVPRDYDHAPLHGPGDVDRFAETVGEYRARVWRVSAEAVPTTVAGLVPRGGRVVVPADLPAAWVGDLDVMRDEPALAPAALDAADAVVTGCAVGIAATGTIVLDGGTGQGRRAVTLVPDHHICIVGAGQIVDTVPQAFARLDPVRPLTFISGPSATSDIELDRVEGVHGPRTLDVVITED